MTVGSFNKLYMSIVYTLIIVHKVKLTESLHIGFLTIRFIYKLRRRKTQNILFTGYSRLPSTGIIYPFVLIVLLLWFGLFHVHVLHVYPLLYKSSMISRSEISLWSTRSGLHLLGCFFLSIHVALSHKLNIPLQSHDFLIYRNAPLPPPFFFLSWR